MRLASLARAARKPHVQKNNLVLAKQFTMPVPTGGWNARDPIAGMPPTDAVRLDNYFPTTADCRLRNGFVSHATGMTGTIDTLMTYSVGPAVNTMWAWTSGGSLFNVSAAGAVGAAALSGRTNGRWQWINFTTSGGTFISAVNGADTAVQYDGTTWANSTMTGVTLADLINVFEFKRRLFFIEKDKLKLWYLPVDSITGALTAFNVQAQFKNGGYLMAGGSLTRDGGDGLDDLLVLISSKGEVIIYQGLDPAVDFTLVGRYAIGAPLGRKCFMKAGADILALTIDGIVGISTIITLDRAASNKAALSDKIRDAFNQASKLYKDNFGWQAISYPRGNMVLFNIPVATGDDQHQYVINPITGAWTRFRGWNANCWVLFEERIYFGGNDGKVYKADEGFNDNGATIQGVVQTAFTYPHEDINYKHFKSVQVIMKTEQQLTYGVTLVTDFETEYSLTFVTFDSGSALSVWNLATWDVDPWATLLLAKVWHDVPARGAAVSVVFSTEVKDTEIQLSIFNVLYEPGGMV